MLPLSPRRRLSAEGWMSWQLNLGTDKNAEGKQLTDNFLLMREGGRDAMRMAD